MKYLLDTNIIIDFFHKKQSVVQNIMDAGIHECCISDLTLYELYYGAQCCADPGKETAKIDNFRDKITIIPSGLCYKEAACQKGLLRAKGKLIEDIDIMIATSALTNNLVLVTNNEKHLSRISGVKIENWLDD